MFTTGKKRSAGLRNKRKRDELNSSSSSSEDEVTSVKLKRQKGIKNPLIQGTKGSFLKKHAGHKLGDRSSSEESDNENESLSLTTVYKSERSKDQSGPLDMGATATVEIDTAYDRDAQAIEKKAIELNKQKDSATEGGDNIYRGLNNYRRYIDKRDTTLGNAGSGLNRAGPQRAPAHLRATIRWDYQPDLCKDYKETGFCGFGDSCKFMHDRYDYKQGWQIEQELKEGRYVEEDTSRLELDSDDEVDSELPFRCLICRESFNNPVVSKCGHYFCEKCALDYYRKKSKRCFVCGTQTLGVFNPAKDIMTKLKRKECERAKENDSDEDDEYDQKTCDNATRDVDTTCSRSDLDKDDKNTDELSPAKKLRPAVT